MLSFIVVGDMGHATCELFLSGSSIFRQMLDKWNVEQMGSRTSDMDPILIPAYKKRNLFILIWLQVSLYCFWDY